MTIFTILDNQCDKDVPLEVSIKDEVYLRQLDSAICYKTDCGIQSIDYVCREIELNDFMHVVNEYKDLFVNPKLYSIARGRKPRVINDQNNIKTEIESLLKRILKTQRIKHNLTIEYKIDNDDYLNVIIGPVIMNETFYDKLLIENLLSFFSKTIYFVYKSTYDLNDVSIYKQGVLNLEDLMFHAYQDMCFFINDLNEMVASLSSYEFHTLISLDDIDDMSDITGLASYYRYLYNTGDEDDDNFHF